MTNSDSPPSSNWRICLALAIGLTFPLIANLSYFFFSPSEEMARWGYGASKAFMIAWAVFCGILLVPLRRSIAAKDELPERRLGWSLGFGAISGLAIIGLILILMQTPLGTVVREGAPLVQDKVKNLGFDRNFLVTALLLSIVHAAFEEFYWRWFVYGTLRKLSKGIWPHVIAAFGFAAHHYAILGAFFPHSIWLVILLGTLVAVGGFIWSQVFVRTGSLAGPWLSHMLVDFGIMWVGWQLLQS